MRAVCTVALRVPGFVLTGFFSLSAVQAQTTVTASSATTATTITAIAYETTAPSPLWQDAPLTTAAAPVSPGAIDNDTTIATAEIITTAGKKLKVVVPPPAPPIPATFQESPALSERVAKGELPQVGQRLPEVPGVVVPVHTVGRYGGSMRKLAANVSDLQMNHRLGYEPLVRWGRDATTIEPGVAESWEMRDGGRTFEFKLRKGMKWSDGHPFTSADFKFTYDFILNYSGFGLVALPWVRADNKLPSIETPDPHTVIYRFDVPYGNFLRGVAASGLQQALFSPKHYLEQFHQELVPKENIEKLVREAGFVTWMDFFLQRMDLSRNPDLPTVAAWKITIPPPASQCVAERNPYYWKVDTDGNQLPYIDRIVTNMVFDRTILNLKALNGNVDFQMRNIDAANYTLFKERGNQMGYETLVTPSTNPICVYVNQYSRNEKLRPILQDVRFRKALSHAINRDELVELIYSGLAKPSSAISMPVDEFFLPGMDKANTKYDPELANRLLDEIGLKRRKGDGLRTLPDGELFSAVLHIYPSEEGTNADLWQLVVDYLREVGLMFAPKQEDQSLSFLQVTAGNSDFFCYSSAALHWAVEGVWKAPISKMSYMAPIYGNYYATDGKDGIRPPPELQRLIDWYEALRATPDESERLRYGHKILQQWAEKCYVVGICQSPVVTIVSRRLKNVPDEVPGDYRLKSPGHLNIEQFYIDEEKGP